ncbi:MAG: hypothetical protein HWN65_17390 [Candidatus Helarchaeota archaeon]|nr:hypothetical protein [Candidatus Helarchaeota archaeon]
MVEENNKVEKLSEALSQVGLLLKKDSVIWPYQKMSINEFMRKYFPEMDSANKSEKFKKLEPLKLLQAIENKLRSISAILGPLEDRMKALEFQKRLLTYFSIYSPDLLGKCREILLRTPRGIREGFTTEEYLELAIEKGFSQKNVAELMALWLNMRYYGALSGALSPKLLITSVEETTALDNKIKSIEKTLNKIEPNVEGKHNDYSLWVRKKQSLDEERKLMTFGPESVQIIETVLESVYFLSVGGELIQKDAMQIVNKAKAIINEAIELGKIEKKTFISKEKREKLENLIKEISEKPYLFFIIAQISNLLKNQEPLKKEHVSTLHKIENVIKLIPESTEEALKNEELKKNLQIIFEPLKFVQLETKEAIPSKQEKVKKKASKKKRKKAPRNIEILKQIFDDTSRWYLNRVIEENKAGLENLLELFHGIPAGLGIYMTQLIINRAIKIDTEKFKEYLIGYLSWPGVYELYSQLGKRLKPEAEIEVAEEIAIPPKADQRLAPLQKQIKFEFMKFLESTKIKKSPVFNILEANKIAPIKFVDLFLEQSQITLIDIINANAERKLHELMKLNPEEYEVKVKTLILKLSSFMDGVSKTFEKVIREELSKKKFKAKNVFKKFRKGIEEIWIESLISTKIIEPEPEPEITTSKVSALAAKLEGRTPAMVTGGSPPPRAPPKAPPSAPLSAPPKAPPSAISRPAPPSIAPPSASDRPAPPAAMGKPVPSPPLKIKSPSGPIVPDFIKPERETSVSVTVKTNKLKETLEEVIKIVESSMADMDKLTPNSLKNALQLVYELRELEKMDASDIRPEQLRRMANLAEALKSNKQMIVIQQEKLKQLETKLSDRAILALDAKLELIAKYFDDFIRDLELGLSQLSGKGEKLIIHFGKKSGKHFWARLRIKKEGTILTKQINIIEKIGELPLSDFNAVKTAYMAFQKARSERKNQLVKKYSQEITNLIHVNRKEFLTLTQDPKLIASLRELFKLTE